MSRSNRTHPFIGTTTAKSEKWWKRLLNRRLRQRLGSTDLQPSKRYVPEWGPKDGKSRFDPAESPKLMRK
jgi:hypothetical protein